MPWLPFLIRRVNCERIRQFMRASQMIFVPIRCITLDLVQSNEFKAEGMYWVIRIYWHLWADHLRAFARKSMSPVPSRTSELGSKKRGDENFSQSFEAGLHRLKWLAKHQILPELLSPAQDLLAHILFTMRVVSHQLCSFFPRPEFPNAI